MNELIDPANLEGSLAALVARAAAVNPEGVAFIEGESQRTWRDVASGVEVKAGVMLDLGLKPGDRIAVLAGVTAQHVELTLILAWAGITVVPLNTRLSLREHIQILKSAAVAALICDAEFADHGRQLALEASIGNVLAIDAILKPAGDPRRSLEPYSWRPQDLAAILYTGGTTGLPKGVRMPVGSFMVHGKNVMQCLGYDRQSVVLHAQPIFHIAGCNQLYGLIGAAGTLVFRSDIGPAATYDEIRRHGVNSVGMVPTSLAMLLNHPSRDDALLLKIRSIVYGAAAIPETLLEQAVKAMPNARFCQFYGQTEAGPVTALLPEDHVLEGPRAGKLKTAGRARPHIQLRIANADGVEVPVGTPGEIILAGAGLCDGYWQAPDSTAQLFRDGWLRTGDVGVLDADGYVTIVDRFKDMIVTGGENVFCAEVEHVLASHPAVEACTVFGVPDEFWGEAVHATVILKRETNADAAELISFCKKQLAGYKCPKSVEMRTEPFPLSGVGKVLKHILRNELIHRRSSMAAT